MFFCDRCGLCCMHLAENFSKNLNRGDGVCKHFNEKTHLCEIYEKRPIFCNVDQFYNVYLSLEITREEFYAINYKSCKIIKERYKN